MFVVLDDDAFRIVRRLGGGRGGANAHRRQNDCYMSPVSPRVPRLVIIITQRWKEFHEHTAIV